MSNENEKRRSERVSTSKGVEFIVDDEVIQATSVDVSENGIRFKTEFPVNILLRIEENDGRLQNRAARLAWARKVESGGMEYGFQYLDT